MAWNDWWKRSGFGLSTDRTDRRDPAFRTTEKAAVSVVSAGRARRGSVRVGAESRRGRGGHAAPYGVPNWPGGALPRGLIFPDDILLSFLEELRRTVPIIDRAQAVLSGLVGNLEVEGDKGVVDELSTFFSRVRVNQMQRGLHSWLLGQVDQLLHYGKAVGEMVPNRSRTDLFARS